MDQIVFRDNALRQLIERLKNKRDVKNSFDKVVDKTPALEICRVLRMNRDRHTQEVLCNALRKKKHPAAIPTLFSILKQTRSPKVRAAAIEALGDLRAISGGPYLIKLFKDARQPVYVRDTAALSLGLIGYHKAEVELINGLRSKIRTIRYCSAKALGFLKSVKALPELSKQLLRERNTSVKHALTEALCIIIKDRK